MKKLSLLALILAGIAASACNTIEGMGEDVESVGETVADEAN
ncbi:MAG: entericidin A/B family lipoprotein [Parasphingopyxis sp.]|nr:entericidin A/B family lipoprotein [Sphingomonadales bacterium]